MPQPVKCNCVWGQSYFRKKYPNWTPDNIESDVSDIGNDVSLVIKDHPVIEVIEIIDQSAKTNSLEYSHLSGTYSINTTLLNTVLKCLKEDITKVFQEHKEKCLSNVI